MVLAIPHARATTDALDAALQPGLAWLTREADESTVTDKIRELKKNATPDEQAYLDEFASIVSSHPKLADQQAFIQLV